MGLLYSGPGLFEEMDSTSGLKDPWNMDSMSRTFAGRKDRLEDFLKTLFKNKQDQEHAQLFLTQWRPRTDRSFGYVDMEFAGLLDDRLPDIVESDDTAIQTVQLTNLAGEQAEIEYKAPTTTIRYVTRERPTKSIYPNRLIEGEDAYVIVNRRGAPNSRALHNLDKLTTTPARSSFPFRIQILNRRTADQVGKYWRVTEVNEGRCIAEDAGRLEAPAVR